MEAKRNIRFEFLEKRQAVLEEGIETYRTRSTQLAEQLKSLLSEKTGKWASYRPKNDEINPNAVTLENGQITWSYPAISGDALEFRVPNNEKSFSKGPFGIEEPLVSESKKIEINQLEGVICPGLSFDRKGNRLGFGKGFYDRVLSQFQGLKVGVCFSEQISEETLPSEGHDISMDVVATDKELIFINEEGVPC